MKDLKTLRDCYKFTLEQLGKQVELTPVTIFNIESQKTIPQADCRHRLELVFGTRINWLQTTGLREQKSMDWEDVESDLRKSLMKVNSLSTEQQDQFLLMAREYVSTLEDLIKEQRPNEEMLLPSDVSNTVMERKRKVLYTT